MTQQITDYIINDIHGGRADLVIAPEDDLLGSGILGSMEMIRLIDFLETEFSFKVAPEDMTIENFMTVQAMVDYVSSVK